MRQLGFPERVTRFIEDYYLHDFVSTSSGGSPTRPLYLSRGLRQGCNLSAILFVIYLSELGNRLRRSGVGIPLVRKILLCFLKFADDLILFALLWSDMMVLVRILERWCVDFQMVISVEKSKVVSAARHHLWRILNLLNDRFEEVELVREFRYLGVLQRANATATVACNASSKIAKAELFKRNILRLRRLIPDRISVYVAIWQNIALPSILYGLEALPFSADLEAQLEKVQISLGKGILGLRASTAGPVVYMELGFKPISLLLSERKVRFVYPITRASYKGSPLVQLVMRRHMEDQSSPFYLDLARRLSVVGVSPESMTGNSVRLLQAHFQSALLLDIGTFRSLSALPLPGSWWKKQLYVTEDEWSLAIREFRSGNARLGNRDDSLRDVAVPNHQGRVVNCPLCLAGPNSEIHLLVCCPVMVGTRRSLQVPGSQSLQNWVDLRLVRGVQPAAIAKEFLSSSGDGRPLGLGEMSLKGYALLDLRDSFFMRVHSRLSA